MELANGFVEAVMQSWDHSQTMGAALVKQHLRPKALLVQGLRACTPVAFLAVLSWAMRTFKDSKMRKKEMLFPDMENKAVDILFSFTALATVMIGFTFFVNRLGVERQSGLRHLMHVSGLSRTAFWTSMVVIEGFFQGMAEALIIAFVGGLVLRVRCVLGVSPILMLTSLSMIVLSAVLFGCMLHMLISNNRAANIAAMTMSVALSFIPVVYGMANGLVPEERISWWMMFCPVVSSYQSLLALINSCGDAGCLQLQSLNDGPFFSPMEMLFGSSRAAEATQGGGFVSLLGQVLFQHAVLWPLVILADMVYYRPLSRGGEAAQNHGSVGSRQGSPRGLADFERATLEVRGLVHWYGWIPGVQTAEGNKVLDGVSFSIVPGAMLGLLGPNGAGKTTAIRCITGEEMPRHGYASLCGPSEGSSATFDRVPHLEVDARPASTEECSSQDGDRIETGSLARSESFGLLGGGIGSLKMRRRGKASYLGLCPQDSALCEDLSVEDHLTLFARLRGCLNPEEVAEHFLQAIRLEHKRSVIPSELSGGMRRRLAVGCSMVGFPALALLDEPTTGLDPIVRREIWTSIMEARDAGTACLLTTHMLEEAEELCTHIVILSRGRVAAEGSVQELKDAWSTGYMLHVDAKAGEQAKAKQFIASKLPELYRTPVKTTLHGQMIFNVSKEPEFVGNLFIMLAREATDNGIRHWGISQASLEDAYMRIIQGGQ